MDVNEWGRTFEQVARERQALNASYAELMEDAHRGAEEARRTGITRPQEELVPELIQLVIRLGNYVDIEREHADKLYALLVEAMTRLAEAYEIDLPQDWPESATQ